MNIQFEPNKHNSSLNELYGATSAQAIGRHFKVVQHFGNALGRLSGMVGSAVSKAFSWLLVRSPKTQTAAELPGKKPQTDVQMTEQKIREMPKPLEPLMEHDRNMQLPGAMDLPSPHSPVPERDRPVNLPSSHRSEAPMPHVQEPIKYVLEGRHSRKEIDHLRELLRNAPAHSVDLTVKSSELFRTLTKLMSVDHANGSAGKIRTLTLEVKKPGAVSRSFAAQHPRLAQSLNREGCTLYIVGRSKA